MCIEPIRLVCRHPGASPGSFKYRSPGVSPGHLTNGFSLIELLVAAAITAIVAAIAVPSYLDHVVRSRRIEAMTELLKLYNLQERFFTAHLRYGGVKELGVPKDLRYYRISLALETSTSYRLLAVPLVGTSQEGDGRLQITPTGIPQWDKLNNGSFTYRWDDR